MKVPNECLYPTDVFLISCGMGCKRITVSDIAYIEAMKDNCIIHMIDGKRYTQSCPMGMASVPAFILSSVAGISYAFI